MEKGEGNAEFAALSPLFMAAHELKSPLVLMRQLAFAALDDSISSDARKLALERLRLVSERSLRLTTDLTRTARLQDSFFDLEPINPSQLCDSIVREIKPLYDQYGRSIRLKSRPSRRLVLAHRELLAGVIYHFADNALHYGDDGSGVTLSLSSNSKTGRLRIAVRDKGPMMSLKEWRKIKAGLGAQPSSRPQSSGLGLYVANQFAGAMNGEIGLTRHSDGLTFYIDLPVSEQLALL